MSLVLTIAIALTASTGCPPTLPEEPPRISTEPEWLAMPSGVDLTWAFPPRAMAQNIGGKATIECEVTIQGALKDCEVVSEEPAGYGFGEAVLALTSKMLFKPALECGRVVPHPVRIPLTFLPPVESETPSSAPLDPQDTKLALAARLVELLDLAKVYAGYASYSGSELVDVMEAERGTSAEERQAVIEAAHATWATWKSKLMNAAARSFASRMSEEELEKAIEFFGSPAGAKLNQTHREVSDDVGEVLKDIEPDMMLEFHRRFCEKMQALCAPEDAL